MRVTVDPSVCERIELLMSPFIDSMTTAEESNRLHGHLVSCEPCQRQMQGLISVKNLVAGIGPVSASDDQVLSARVRLSHARSRSNYDRWHTRLNNMLRPLAVPAISGVSLTFLFFAVLFGNLVSNRVVLADRGGPTIATYQPLQPIEWLGSPGQHTPMDEPLSIATEVSHAGRVFDYRIIAGTRSPDVDRWVRELVVLARFRPATSFGVPVQSRIILSFVNVRA
jgi:hypothetical protein